MQSPWVHKCKVDEKWEGSKDTLHLCPHWASSLELFATQITEGKNVRACADFTNNSIPILSELSSESVYNLPTIHVLRIGLFMIAFWTYIFGYIQAMFEHIKSCIIVALNDLGWSKDRTMENEEKANGRGWMRSLTSVKHQLWVSVTISCLFLIKKSSVTGVTMYRC